MLDNLALPRFLQFRDCPNFLDSCCRGIQGSTFGCKKNNRHNKPTSNQSNGPPRDLAHLLNPPNVFIGVFMRAAPKTSLPSLCRCQLIVGITSSWPHLYAAPNHGVKLWAHTHTTPYPPAIFLDVPPAEAFCRLTESPLQSGACCHVEEHSERLFGYLRNRSAIVSELQAAPSFELVGHQLHQHSVRCCPGPHRYHRSQHDFRKRHCPTSLCGQFFLEEFLAATSFHLPSFGAGPWWFAWHYTFFWPTGHTPADWMASMLENRPKLQHCRSFWSPKTLDPDSDVVSGPLDLRYLATIVLPSFSSWWHLSPLPSTMFVHLKPHQGSSSPTYVFKWRWRVLSASGVASEATGYEQPAQLLGASSTSPTPTHQSSSKFTPFGELAVDSEVAIVQPSIESPSCCAASGMMMSSVGKKTSPTWCGANTVPLPWPLSMGHIPCLPWLPQGICLCTKSQQTSRWPAKQTKLTAQATISQMRCTQRPLPQCASSSWNQHPDGFFDDTSFSFTTSIGFERRSRRHSDQIALQGPCCHLSWTNSRARSLRRR